MINLKLQKIINKYCSIIHNEDNYEIGGGLDTTKFASRRHEDAKDDEGKLTEGQATQLFKKATSLELDIVKAIINYAMPNMEWHHAGKLPKSYGGGMKKTYFLNAKEICKIATNWDSYYDKYQISLAHARTEAEIKKELEAKKQVFLIENAIKKTRILLSETGLFFYEIDKEMDGKYGWFSSYGKSYSMTEYYSGWKFENEEKYRQFLNIK